MKQETLQSKAIPVAERYVELTKQGFSDHRICILLDISRNTLYKYLSQAGVQSAKKTKLDAFAFEKGAEIKEMLEKGANLLEVQTHFKIGHSALQRVLNKLGIKYDKSKTNKAKGTIEEIHKMIEMRKEGKTLQAIGDIYGVTRERIRQQIASVQPEVVLQGLGPRTQRFCVVCESPIIRRSKHDTCSHHCYNVKNQKFIFTRDDALRIMKCRDEGKTWEQIGTEYGFKKPYLFRIYLERKINIILSSEEKAKYIRPSGKDKQ